MEPARSESCSSGQRRHPAAPGKDAFPSPDQKFFHVSTTPANRGRKLGFPGSIPIRTVWKPEPHWLVADWRGLVEPARGERFPSGKRRGSAAPEEDKFPPPDQKSCHVSTTPAKRGRKRRSPRSIPLRTVWKPQPHWPIVDWLGLMESARGECFPSGQRRGPAAPGEDRVLSPDHKSFHISTTNSNKRGTKTEIARVDTASRGVETPTTLASCSLAGAHGASARRGLPLGTTSRSRRTRRG